jgi:hypothetical protein
MSIVLRLTTNGLVYYFLAIYVDNSHAKHMLSAKLHSYLRLSSSSFTSPPWQWDREHLFQFFVIDLQMPHWMLWEGDLFHYHKCHGSLQTLGTTSLLQPNPCLLQIEPAITETEHLAMFQSFVYKYGKEIPVAESRFLLELLGCKHRKVGTCFTLWMVGKIVE